MFYPDYERELRNFDETVCRCTPAGCIRPNRFFHFNPLSPSVRAHPPRPPPSLSSLVRHRCFAGHSISIMLNIEVLCILPHPWNAQETRVPFVTARNGTELLIALFTISFHTTRVCVLFISRGNTQEDISMFRETPRSLAENMRRLALVWKLLLQVTFCISATLGCNDVQSKSELSL